MATKKQTPPSGTTTTTAPAQPTGVSAATQAALDKYGITFPGGTNDTSQLQSSPIGDVPYYATDPVTGEISRDDNGNPVRWTAVRAVDNRVLRSHGEAPNQTYGVLPRYYQGDTAAILTGLPPEVLADLQLKMVALKLYGSAKPNITYGIADPETVASFAKILGVANSSGYTYDEVMSMWSSRAIADLQPPEAAPKHVINTTNTDELVSVFKDAARRSIGREVSDDQARRMAQSYQAQEVAMQQQVNAFGDAADAGGTMTMQGLPSAQTFAETSLKASNPGEYDATRAASTLEDFRSILAGPFGGK